MNLFNILKKTKMDLPNPEKALKGRKMPQKIINNNVVLNAPLRGPFPEHYRMVHFGMGCFWGAEKLFWTIPGICTTAVGYGAGHTPNPTYEEVCSGMTGHNELVLVVYDPDQVTFQQLLTVFWENHNPTEGMRQGNDIGTQYRSGIYPTTPDQRQLAENSKRIYDQQLRSLGKALSTTEIRSEIEFFYAEDYHQQYLAKNPLGYCPNHAFQHTGLPAFPGFENAD